MMVSNSSKTHFTADMSAYEVARELDVDLGSGDATGVGEPQLVSSDSIKEIVKCLDEMHMEIANFRLKCKEDIWNNQEFFSFLKDYFQNSLSTLDFCTDLEYCLQRTCDNQLIVQSAVRHFKEEMDDEVKYVKTLKELRNFKDTEDSFTDEFLKHFQSVCEQHKLMLEKLQPPKAKLDKKLEIVKTWWRVCNCIFVVAFVSVLILMVVAAAIKAPAWATALMGALSVPMGSVGTWLNSLWRSYHSALEGKGGVINSMRDGTLTTKKDLGNIEALVRKLRIETNSMLEKADFALREEEAMTLVIDEIQKQLEMFMNIAQNLSANSERCSSSSVSWRKLVLKSTFRHVWD